MPWNADVEWLKQHPDPRLVVGVAVDGSSIGDKALQAAVALHRERRADRLVLLHVGDGSKASWLPRHLTPRYLESTYVGKAADLHVHAEWAYKEKADGQSTCEALTALAESQAVGLLVVGSYGRKGEKSFDMLGHVSDYSLRESHCSVCIVRSSSPPAGLAGEQDYLFATDGSKAAALAFCTLVRQVLRPGDKVLVAQATYDHGAGRESDELFEPYKKMMDAHKARLPRSMMTCPHYACKRLLVSGECLVWHVSRERRVSEGILELATARQTNVLVVGISGYGRTKLGSVSEELILKAPCTTLVLKDRGDAAGGGSANMFASAGARTLAGMLAPQGAPRASNEQRSSLERVSLQAGGGEGKRGQDKGEGARGAGGCIGAGKQGQ